VLASPQTAAEERRAAAHIRAAAELIRAGWSPAEFRRRAGLSRQPSPWTPLTVDVLAAEEKLLEEADE